ncbi:MAG TPA: invasin domain 3-containing protein, partial [Gemmatimonadaceae bacterium]|nr:invasin domain 3-containing protein [Gemmatimonadaceae bacterium]
GALSLVGTITNAGTGAGTTTISGAMGASVAGITQNSATSPLSLTGVNTYSAPTTVLAGILVANSSTALGDGSATNSLILAGATLQATATINSPVTRPITLTGTATINAVGVAVSLAGAVGGGGGLTKTGTGTLTFSGPTTIGGNFTITTGTVVAPNVNSFVVAGNWTNNATFTNNAGTVTFGGGIPQTLGGTSATTFNNATLSSAGVTISRSPTVNGALTFINGKITTGAQRVTIGAAGTVTGATGAAYVVGNLERFVPVAAPTVRFDVGDVSAYAPVVIDFTGATNGVGSLTASTTAGDHPSVATSGINAAKSANRYWTVVNGGVGGFTSYDGTFNFVAGDVDAGANTSSFVVRKFDVAGWSSPVSDTQTATSIRATGMSTFSNFAVGESSPTSGTSTLTPTSASIVANGTSTQPLTVTTKDASGTPLTTGGAAVAITKLSGTGTISAVTDVGNGTYTATVTSPTLAGSGVFVATVGGTPVQSGTASQTQATVTYGFGAASATASTLTPTAATITANGTSTQLLTVTAKDVTGNLISAGGATVTITKASGTGTIGPVTDVGNGTYTATVTSPTLAGSGVFVATVGGTPVQSGTASQAQAIVSYVGGTPDALKSTLTPIAATIAANGTSTQILTVTAKDATNNVMTAGGATVTITKVSGTGTIGAVTDVGDGTYTATVTSPTLAGSGLFVATLGASPVQSGTASQTQATVTYAVGGASAAASTLTPTAANVLADGASTQLLTVTAKDATGNPLTIGGATVTITKESGTGTISAVTDVGNGTYAAIVTAPTTLGSGVFVATIGGGNVQSGTATATQAIVSYVSGAPTKYVVAAGSNSPIAGTLVTISAQLASANNNPVATVGLIVTWSKTGNGGSFASATSATDANGIASVVFTTAPSAGTVYTFTATDQNKLTGTSGNVTSAVGGPSPTRTTATLAATGVVGTAADITVKLVDAFGNPVAGQGSRITFAVTGANFEAVVRAISESANRSGSYLFNYTSTRPGIDSVAILVDGVPITGSPFVRTVAPLESQLALAIVASNQNPAVGDTVTIVMTVTNSGAAPATQAQVASVIPMERFVRLSLVVSQGTFNDTNQLWAIGTLAAQASATLTFRGVVKLPTGF